MWYQEVGNMRFNLFTLHARVNGHTPCTVYTTPLHLGVSWALNAESLSCLIAGVFHLN